MTPRDSAVAWALEVLRDPSAVVFDCETTGLRDDSEIVDVTILTMGGRVLLDLLICPLRPIPAQATQVHGITERMVHKAPLFKEAYQRIAPVLAGRRVIAWNSPFDQRLLDQCCRADRLPVIGCRWEDAMQHYGAFRGEPSQRGDGYRWWRLSDACRHCGIKAGTHRAKADAIACLAVIAAMAASETPIHEETSNVADSTAQLTMFSDVPNTDVGTLRRAAIAERWRT